MPGALYQGDGRCLFRVWAPKHDRVSLRLLGPPERLVPMEKRVHGYHEVAAQGVSPGALYTFRLGAVDRPDPASRHQPQDVHGPSAVVDPAFPWTDERWRGPLLEDYVLYELHVGTFSESGTLASAETYLRGLRELGVTAVELMPLGQFPGTRNWGYDGVYPYAVQESYGGPRALKHFVDACHREGLAIVLDVVYNHLGPEGNYCADFGPYFTNRYHTPWGPALNFDGPESDPVRWHFIHNALQWVDEYHIDALRLDAVHAIADESALPFVQELTEAVHHRAAELGRRVQVMPESNANNPRLLQTPEVGGYGLDAVWNDDLHHCLHTLLTGESNGYYADFRGVEDLAKAYREGFVNAGRYSPFFRRRYGLPSGHIPAKRFIVFSQNHDQVGNRMMGDRLAALVPFEAQKLAAAAVVLSPFVPMLFMGEEYGATTPFQYFVSHSDPGLIDAVRKGRREEFAAFGWQGETPDPQDEATFLRSKLDLKQADTLEGKALLAFYRELLRLRRELPALALLSKDNLEALADEEARTIVLRRWAEGQEAVIALNFGNALSEVRLPPRRTPWRKEIDSADKRWLGRGEDKQDDGGKMARVGPLACVLYVREEGI